MVAAAPHTLSAAELALRIGRGELSAVEAVTDCLARIEAADGDVQAWQFLDGEHAMAQAKALDLRRAEGRPTGRLHGVPVAVKDIFDTGDMPTELGSPLYSGRTPRRDAACVARLRAAGAVIMGKSVTTEFACLHPGKTRNPHDPRRTPGGSSSGSAAAVAAMMVPGAVGSQTNGSVIRPASFCGVVGFKPSHGVIPRSGALILSRTLDHVGVFARTVEDAALFAEVMAGFDADDADTQPIATPPLTRVAAEAPPLPPKLGMVRTAAWDQAEPQTHAAFAELIEALGERVAEAALPQIADHVFDLHRIVMDVEIAHNLRREYEDGGDQLSAGLRDMIARGRTHLAFEYRRAVDLIDRINAAVDELFDQCDALVTPAAPGEAPVGLGSTGNPAFCTIWTYLGLPAVSLPLLRGENGMPIGVQLVGRRGNDARLLRTARWLAGEVGGGKRGRRRA
ncbi:amidase [Desertibaculum subflavum]|uniref:amidase n=1 Tax=Desertibaculum subflavum TaxID=2268458 RepID=UPI000E66347F